MERNHAIDGDDVTEMNQGRNSGDSLLHCLSKNQEGELRDDSKLHDSRVQLNIRRHGDIPMNLNDVGHVNVVAGLTCNTTQQLEDEDLRLMGVDVRQCGLERNIIKAVGEEVDMAVESRECEVGLLQDNLAHQLVKSSLRVSQIFENKNGLGREQRQAIVRSDSHCHVASGVSQRQAIESDLVDNQCGLDTSICHVAAGDVGLSSTIYSEAVDTHVRSRGHEVITRKTMMEATVGEPVIEAGNTDKVSDEPVIVRQRLIDSEECIEGVSKVEEARSDKGYMEDAMRAISLDDMQLCDVPIIIEAEIQDLGDFCSKINVPILAPGNEPVKKHRDDASGTYFGCGTYLEEW
ncbi:hypothetical protein SESBI_44628 [Sesbania bispinosa]|nr:hypothetical protein SESBI_44628 [Sesbania bispinosa]